MTFRRTAVVETELGGKRILPGDKVVFFYPSGNRDGEVFADPDAFDLSRSPNPHVGFGGPGPHFCLGAHLARREIAAVLSELLRRTPEVTVTGEPRRLRSMFINGIKHLPVAVSPRGH